MLKFEWKSIIIIFDYDQFLKLTPWMSQKILMLQTIKISLYSQENFISRIIKNSFRFDENGFLFNP